jgi:oxalate---CoA ligase
MADPLLALLDASSARPALVVPDDGTCRSHAQLAEAAAALAGGLAAAGVGRGERVAAVLANGPEPVVLLFALSVLGAALAPLNPAYTEPEVRFFLEDIRPRLLVLGTGVSSAAAAAAGDVPVLELAAWDGTRVPRLSQAGRALPTDPASAAGGPDDTALLLHTSGTTSRPKQVPLLQRNLTAQARAIADHYALGDGDVSYCAMPLFHVHGLVASALAQLAAGGSVVVPRRFGPRRFWAQAAEHGVTWLSAGPTLHRMILDHPGQAPATLRFARSCSSALTPELWREAEARYGVPVTEAYGMTENTHQMTSNPLPPAERRPGSVGIPAGAEVRIVDAAGNDVPDGGAGEVAIRGPGLTPGYLGNDAANAESFFDGWFRTGDEGVLEDGYLTLRGRLKEMILRGGENISPYEIEAVLQAHPQVAEAVAFGVEDAKYGQTVAAAVVLRGAAGAEELRDHARRSLAAFKVPERIHVLEEIPKTPTGKVQRPRMAALLEGEGR